MIRTVLLSAIGLLVFGQPVKSISKQTLAPAHAISASELDCRKLICGISDEKQIGALFRQANIKCAVPIKITVTSGKITRYEGSLSSILEPLLFKFLVPKPDGSYNVIFATWHYKRLCNGKYHAALFTA